MNKKSLKHIVAAIIAAVAASAITSCSLWNGFWGVDFGPDGIDNISVGGNISNPNPGPPPPPPPPPGGPGGPYYW